MYESWHYQFVNYFNFPYFSGFHYSQSLISLSIRIATVEPDLLPPHYSHGLQRLVEYVEALIVFMVGMGKVFLSKNNINAKFNTD